MDSHNTLPIKKLLVAEDNESNFLLVMAILKKEYQIIHAVDGVETLQKYRQYSPDAILMDLKMPNMDGLEATREIRKLNTYIPIIIVSAFAFDSDKQEANEAGCTDYLTKPIDSRLLKETLKKYHKEVLHNGYTGLYASEDEVKADIEQLKETLKKYLSWN